MTRHEQITRGLRELERGSVQLQIRYPALFQLHLAAAMANDREEMNRLRVELHAMLDYMLDNVEAVQHLARELANLS